MSPATEKTWGPLPDLAETIARQFAPWSPLRTDWPRLTAANGGVWIWPLRAEFAETEPVTPVATPLWQKPPRWRWLRWVAESWFGRTFDPPKDDRLSLDPEAWGRRVVEAQSWLARRNTRLALPWFAALARVLPTAFSETAEPAGECPPSLTRHLNCVSPVGVFWGLAAWELANGRLFRLEFLKPGQNSLAPRLRPERLGDMLALHFLIESLVAGQPRARILEGTPPRAGGGLRQPSFVQAYPWLVADPLRKPWVEMLDCFIAQSPLTQIVYADLIAEPDPVVARRALLMGPDVADWHEAWFSHLARSLVAVVESPPVMEEELVWARRRLLEWRPGKRWFGWLEPRESPELKAARGRLTELENARGVQYLARLRFLGALFDHTADGHLAAAFLKARFWDMFVRSFFARVTPELVQAWQQLIDESLTGPLGRQRLLIGDQKSPGLVFARLMKLLAGRDVGDLAKVKATEWPVELRERFFDGATPLLEEQGRREVARAAGLRADVVHSTHLMLTNDSPGIALPFPNPDHRGPAPARYLSEWSLLLGSLLPSAQATVTTTETTETVTVPEGGAAADDYGGSY